MDGVETLRVLRERLPALPVVIASGYGADGAFQTLAAIPGVQFLPKPFGMAELTAAVARAVESHVDTLRA
jgi:CheY-like chemotaxis protein